jgi:VanZ family protein
MTQADTVRTADRDPHGARLLAFAAAYAAFVVYGSLIPFNFHRIPIAEAWRAYLAMPYLELGVESRADWVANLLLYIPLSFLLQGALASPWRSRLATGGVAAVTLVLCVGLAALIEFVQIYFPGRTVSLNDVIAESLGSLIGLAAWLLWGGAFLRAAATVLAGGAAARIAALWLYVLAYLAWSLFPYDFVISAAELASKLGGDNVAWLIAKGSRCDRLIACGLESGIEALSFVPFGILLAILGRPRKGELARSFALGLACGIVIEVLQIGIASGVSQGLSGLTRGAGALAGTALYRVLERRNASVLQKWIRPSLALASPLYVVTACYVSGWFSAPWLDVQAALGRLSEVEWMPFYYHYFTSETAATVSLTLTALLYAALGAARWLWSPDDSRTAGVAATALVAAALATLIETGKLFVPNRHPDPTDILIAAVSAPLALVLCRLFARSALATVAGAVGTVALQAASGAGPGHGNVGAGGVSIAMPAAGADPGRIDDRPAAAAPVAAVRRAQASVAARATQIVALCATVYSIVEYPFPYGLAAFVACYALLLWRYPYAWQAVVLAALPVMDLAHWSGRFYWDEFDVLLLATIAMVAPRLDFSGQSRSPGFAAIMAIVVVAYAASLAIGIFPLSALDGNAFNNYYSHFAALRSVKGLLWGLALLVLIEGDSRSPSTKMRWIVWGMAWGLALEVAFVMWERVSFSGLFNFSDDYRITGTFSVMHTGGAYIEAYLVAAMPFLAYLAVSTRSIPTWGFCAAVFLGSVYALMVTFSRGGYAALAIAGAICTLGIFLGAARARHGLRRVALSAAVIAIGSLIIIPIMSGPYMKERFAAVQEDLATRTSHWSDALAFRDRHPLNLLFGMGLGSYPETYFWRNQESVTPATYRFLTEDGNTFLRLSSGDSLYFEQLVTLEPFTQYELSFDARAAKGEGALTIPICEKWMLYSFRCEWHEWKLDAKNGDSWRHFTIAIDSKDLGTGRWYERRTVKLTLFESGLNSVVDVDNVRLTSATSGNLVRNGGFEQRMDHWFFSTDNHLPWHIKNLWVHLLFELGWVGAVAVGILTVATVCVLLPAMLAGDYLATTLLASLFALLTVGMVDSLVDSPRHLLLFVLVIGLGWLYARPASMHRRERPA